MNVAIILSGGVGTRLGTEIPKQYLKVDNKMIINYCMDTLYNHSKIDCLQIVAESNWRDDIIKYFELNNISTHKFKGFSNPGKTRQGSILNALNDIKKYADEDSVVIIHDAARPLLSNELINSCLDKVNKGYDGVLPILKAKDTMYLINDSNDKIEGTLDRNKVVSGQAPEAFVLSKYYNANISLDDNEFDKINGSSEPAIISGMNIAVVEGEEINFKITTMEDLEKFKQIINLRR